MIHLASQGKHLCATTALRTHLCILLSPMSDDVSQLTQRLHIVDQRRSAVQPLLSRIRRTQMRETALALH